MVILRMLVDPNPDTEESLELMEQNRLKLCKLLSEDWEDEKKIEIKNINKDIDNNIYDNINIDNNDFNEFARKPTNTHRIPGFCEPSELYRGNNASHSFAYYDYASNTKHYRDTTEQLRNEQDTNPINQFGGKRTDQYNNRNYRNYRNATDWLHNEQDTNPRNQFGGNRTSQ